MKQFLFFLLFYYIQSDLTNEERKNLFKKVTKLLTFNKYIFSPLKDNSEDTYKEIKYEASKINELLKKYNFPNSYNYIKEQNMTPIIKNQGYCGSCWSFASSTALSYRFHKKGINVDLSPQYPLSCYIRDCDMGDHLIDSNFNLVKNGTVTEECMPYSSSDGINYEILECPSKCEDGSDIIKYYSKSAYTTKFDYNQENYYDIVTLMIDQLINYGPLQSEIDVYDDFSNLIYEYDCENLIYRHDEKYSYVGGHAVVIVGYGVVDNQFYWIIQNSWGYDFCNNGFAKIEFAEIGIESVVISEPYIENNSSSKDISITFNNLGEDCSMKFSSTDSENNFEMYFKNDNSKIYFQCGSNFPTDNNEGICSISLRSAKKTQGIYKYSEHNALLNSNKYNLNFYTIPNQFNFYGYNFISPYFANDITYISQIGNKIILYYESYEDNSNILPNIYPNNKVNTPLSQCKLKNYDSFKMIICDVQSSEFSYFSSSPNESLAYDILCGYKEEVYSKIDILDTNKYPVFKIKRIIIENMGYISYNNNIVLIADVEGSFTQNYDYFTFLSLIKAEYNKM